LQLTFPSKAACIELVKEISAETLHNLQKKLNQLARVHNLAGKIKVEIDFLKPHLFQPIDSQQHLVSQKRLHSVILYEKKWPPSYLIFSIFFTRILVSLILVFIISCLLIKLQDIR
jgi:hypothetical protein